MTALPFGLDIPPNAKKPGPWLVLSIGSASDGDPSKRGGDGYMVISNDTYRVLTGNKWAEHQDLPRAGVSYVLDRLPNGYQLMDVAKTTDPTVRYKRLFGHPSGKYYNAVPQFFPHFLWLMGAMNGKCECMNCPKRSTVHPFGSGSTTNKHPGFEHNTNKILVVKTRPVRVSQPPSALQHFQSSSVKKGRPTRAMIVQRMREHKIRESINISELGKRAKPVPNYYDKDFYKMRGKRTMPAPEPVQSLVTDEEGTPDFFKEYVEIMYRHRSSKKLVDEVVKEPASPDWRAEHNDKHGDTLKIMDSHLTNVLLQHSFVPRIGELVLWCREHPDEFEIVYNPTVGGYQFYSSKNRTFHGFPRWLGGLITQTPSTDDTLDFPDILCVVNRKDSLNRAGFRVELFPDPNNDTEKSASKVYKYVSLRHVRPLNQWQNVLGGIPDNRLDPSIKYALTCMPSLTVIGRYRFAGRWPEASVLCKGIYLGAELLIEGDAIKILPETSLAGGLDRPSRCTDVLVISSIRVQLSEIANEHMSVSSPLLCGKSSVVFVGKAYTTNRDHPLIRHTNPQPISKEVMKYALPTVGASAYGQWYNLHDENSKIVISHDRVIGRLYESGAMGLWSGTFASRATKDLPPSLSSDMAGVLAGRRYGTLADERIPNVPAGSIYWLWADTRVKALSLETVNGCEVGQYHSVRDPRTVRSWRAKLKYLDGAPTTEVDKREAMFGGVRGRKKGSRLVNGVIVAPDEESESEEIDTPIKGSFSEAAQSRKPANAMINAGARIEEDESEDEDDSSEGSESGTVEESEEDSEEAEDHIPSKVSIMERNSTRESEEPDIPMPIVSSDVRIKSRSPPPWKNKIRPTLQDFSTIKGPIKAGKSAGIHKARLILKPPIQQLPTSAARTDNGTPIRRLILSPPARPSSSSASHFDNMIPSSLAKARAKATPRPSPPPQREVKTLTPYTFSPKVDADVPAPSIETDEKPKPSPSPSSDSSSLFGSLTVAEVQKLEEGEDNDDWAADYDDDDDGSQSEDDDDGDNIARDDYDLDSVNRDGPKLKPPREQDRLKSLAMFQAGTRKTFGEN